MTKLCDFCGEREATLEDSSTLNGVKVIYSFCEECYKSILLSGRNVQQVMQEKLTEVGKVCKTCGCTIADFRKSFLFGCPDCYKYMREAAFKSAEEMQGATYHIGKRL